MANSKRKRVRIWLYQTDLSGNLNGHFDTIELGEDSTRKDVVAYASQFYHKCFNIIDAGVFESKIGEDKDFCPRNIGAWLK